MLTRPPAPWTSQMARRELLVASDRWPHSGFHPSDPDVAKAALEKLSPRRPAAETRDSLAVVVPHAGWQYSGEVAGQVFSSIRVPRRVVVLCPNHTGHGKPLSLWPGGTWLSPLGEVPIDRELNDLLAQGCEAIETDTEAHASPQRPEHAIEVLLPFLHWHQPDLRISAVVVGESRIDVLRSLGHALAHAAETLGSQQLLIVSSSDMSHYLPDTEARRRDRLAIGYVEKIDDAGLLDVCQREEISMCGRHPTAAVLWAARLLGARSAELLGYATSGDAPIGDRASVVGYAGLAIGHAP